MLETESRTGDVYKQEGKVKCFICGTRFVFPDRSKEEPGMYVKYVCKKCSNKDILILGAKK